MPENALKPPYEIPSMSAISALESNGCSVVSTFSGGGGSCTGYRMAGYRVLWANEYVEAAQATYRANHPETLLDVRDIREVQASEILEAIKLDKGEIDLLDGSPPCAGFSSAGVRDKGWGTTKQYSTGESQVVDDLFFEFARLLRDLQPRTFVAENVSGLIKGTAKGYFKLILDVLKRAGYRVSVQLVNAAWLGVPQARERLVFVGVREDLALDPVFPKPLAHHYTTRDVLPHIRRVKHGGAPHRWLDSNRIHPTIVASVISPTAYLSGGQYVSETNEGIPRTPRRLSIDECKTICSFPADYVLTGDERAQWERMGRSVPPLMMRAISAALYEQVLDKVKQ